MPLVEIIHTQVYNASYWAAWTAFTLGWGFRAGGREFLPHSGPALIVANHQSYFDPILIGLAAHRPLTYLARSTLFKKRILATIIRSYGAVPIDRGYGREGLQTVFETLDQGRAVVMFPEGERSHDGQINELKAGISLIVKRTTAPIIPCGLAGGYDMWSRHDKRPRLSPLFMPDAGRSLAVVFGEAVPPELYRSLDRDAILADMRDRIVKAHAAADQLRRKPASLFKS